MIWRIIGSTAAYHWFPTFRAPADLDLLTPSKIKSTDIQECLVDCQWHDLAAEIIAINKDPVFLDPDLLFTLKVSHAEWNIKWDKTMYDIEFFKRAGCSLNIHILKKLIPIWSTVHGKKRVNMNQNVDVFFNDQVHRKYAHEELHEHLAFYDRPLHERIRPTVNNVWCSENMFNSLSVQDQELCALEEIMTIAVERFDLTADSSKSEIFSAASKAHKQLVTTMTTGWFALFLILRRHELLFGKKDIWFLHLQEKLQSLTQLTTLRN